MKELEELKNIDKSYEYLEKLQSCSILEKTKAKKYAAKAVELNPRLELDTTIILSQYEKSPLNVEKILDEAVKKEEKYLKKEGFFTDDYIGIFYGVVETRPYLRGLYQKAKFYILEGKISLAKEICLEILRLNENDNMGARYLLMAIYAYFEDEKEMLTLYKKYKQETFEMLYPLFALYYKLGNDKKAKDYLKKIHENNSHFIEYVKDTIKKEKGVPEGCYAIGCASEILMYFDEFEFLTNTMLLSDDYILENIK